MVKRLDAATPPTTAASCLIMHTKMVQSMLPSLGCSHQVLLQLRLLCSQLQANILEHAANHLAACLA